LGGSNFIVTALDQGLERVDGLINEIGAYSGRVPIGFRSNDEGVAFLEIQASGPWSFTFQSVLAAEQWDAEVAGEGSTVLFYTGSTAIVDYSYVGESNYIVTFYGLDSSIDGLVNEIGTVSGAVPISGPGLVEVRATGTWTFTANPV